MPHQQMRLHLAHGVQHHTNKDEHAGPPEKRSHGIGNPHFVVEQ